MSNKIVNIGIIGTGKLGTYHLEKLQNISNCNLVGIYDINQDTLNEYEKKYQVNICNSLEDLFEKCDAIIIATPTITHYEIARKAIKKGLHVFIEKPITDKLEDALELKALARNNIIQVGHVERFNSAYKKSLEYIDNPQFIEIHRISPFPKRSLDIPVVMDLMIHDLDILLSITKNNSIKEIHATGASVITDFIDLANARIEFDDGLVANLTASRISRKQMRKIRIFQPRSYIGIDLFEKKLDVYSINKDNFINNEPIQLDDTDALEDELCHFIESIIKKRQPLVSVNDGIEALNLAIRVEDLIHQVV